LALQENAEFVEHTGIDRGGGDHLGASPRPPSLPLRLRCSTTC